MPYLIRRISRAKWGDIDKEDTNKIDVSADAITSCLKTTQNDLSVWTIQTEKDFENAILALITGSNQTKLSTLHYVIIDEDLIHKNGLTLVKSDGDTLVPDLVNSHQDISNLTYNKLGIVKNIIIDSLRNEKYSFFTRKKLKELILKAISDGRLNKNDLNEEFIRKEKL